MDSLTQRGIAAAKSGRKAEAYRLLTESVKTNPRDALAWLWLSGVVDNDDDRRTCLENVLGIDPQNESARLGLTILSARQEPTIKPLSGTELPLEMERPVAPEDASMGGLTKTFLGGICESTSGCLSMLSLLLYGLVAFFLLPVCVCNGTSLYMTKLLYDLLLIRYLVDPSALPTHFGYVVLTGIVAYPLGLIMALLTAFAGGRFLVMWRGASWSTRSRLVTLAVTLIGLVVCCTWLFTVSYQQLVDPIVQSVPPTPTSNIDWMTGGTRRPGR